MLIDISYFTEGARKIENAAVTPTTTQSRAVNERIEGYISQLEGEFLRSMVGKDIAEQMQEKEELEGILLVTREKLKESYADYVFYHILRDINHVVTVTGIIKLKCANAYQCPADAMAYAWNRMVDNNRRFIEWASGDGCPLSIRVSNNMLSPINTMNL